MGVSLKLAAAGALALGVGDLAVVEEHRNQAYELVAHSSFGRAVHIDLDTTGAEYHITDSRAEEMLRQCDFPYRTSAAWGPKDPRPSYPLHLVDVNGNDYPCEKGSKGWQIQQAAKQKATVNFDMK